MGFEKGEDSEPCGPKTDSKTNGIGTWSRGSKAESVGSLSERSRVSRSNLVSLRTAGVIN